MSVKAFGMMLPIGSVEIVKGFNPRRTFGEVELQELADSIKADGIIEPLIVRREGKAVKLVAGERRLRAAKLAGLKEVPCIVRELTEAEALRLAVLENLQRVDVSALEEADGFARLIADKQFTADTLATHLGKSREHVYGRLRLLKLDKSVLAALDAGDIEASVAGLLAKFPTALQPAVLKRLRLSDSMSVRDAKREIEDVFRPLTDATWLKWTKGKCQEGEHTSKPTLCATCPHNSANMPDMGAQKKPVCLNSECYESKTKEHGRWQIAEAEKAGRTVVEIPKQQWDYCGSKLGHNCAWQGLDEKAYELPHSEKKQEYLSWREWLQEIEFPVAIALSPSGLAVEIVKPGEVRAKLIELKKIKPEKSAGKAATKEERAAVIKENKEKRAATKALVEACLAAAEKLGELEFWKLLAWHADLDYGWKSKLAELLQVKNETTGGSTEAQLQVACDALKPAERQRKLLEADLWRGGEWEPYRVDEWATLLGLTKAKVKL